MLSACSLPLWTDLRVRVRLRFCVQVGPQCINRLIFFFIQIPPVLAPFCSLKWLNFLQCCWLRLLMLFKCLKSLGFQTDVLGHGSAMI